MYTTAPTSEVGDRSNTNTNSGFLVRNDSVFPTYYVENGSADVTAPIIRGEVSENVQNT
jgi:hypothetical protein